MDTLLRDDYRLSDALRARSGAVFLMGTQALIRLLLMQAQRDAARGLHTRGFLSGYRGSPLGGVDLQAWKAQAELEAHGVHFLPAINEELAATAVLGTQRIEGDPRRTADGVYAMWYGKGPGVDRAGDALKHGNAYGSSPHGGVLVVAGDDHGCVSSSMPHQSDLAFVAWQMPVLAPANVAEMLLFGLYGYELSRFSGHWIGMTALSEVVESAATVDLDAIDAEVGGWKPAAAVAVDSGWQAPADGLHNRWPDLPSLKIEERLAHKRAALHAYAGINSIDRLVVDAPHARVGIVSCGKAHLDLLEALRRLDVSPARLAVHGVRLYKVGLSFPLEPTRVRAFAGGLAEILVIEEKAPVVEDQLRQLLYNDAARPRIVGKQDAGGEPLVPALGELRPSRLTSILAAWLARHCPGLDRRDRVADSMPPPMPADAAAAVKRLPTFCPGCPHNTSTRVPQGSQAQAGIGCHFMASWMERSTTGLIQMGGEGVDWVSHALFTEEPHVFQNLGDGTYYHSGYLAIRQAVAAGTRITYKILYNDAVAMTGGQPIDGRLTVDGIARQVEAEGVRHIVVVSDDIAKYRGQASRFPAGTRFHDRAELDAVQRRLRELDGVSVLIYEQTCAAEKRRRRHRGVLAEPARRLMINEEVCEGCGDCAVQSNCVAVLPVETPLGRKRRIDQSSCNKDYSCAQGFCPSFVSVVGGRLRGATIAPGLEARLAALPPPTSEWSGRWDLLIAGVGGTGVITIGSLVAMAAHLEGKSASLLDFTGFAQKGGAVLSFVRLAGRGTPLHQARIDVGQADALLACDLVVGASPEALATLRHGHARVLANTHAIPVVDALRHPDSEVPVSVLLARLRHAAGDERVQTLDAQQLAEGLLGDGIVSNMLALGHAWQLGLVPVSLRALLRAIELNDVAVDANRLAFSVGRLSAVDPARCRELLAEAGVVAAPPEDLDALIARGMAHLRGYQDARYAQRWRATVDGVRERESALRGAQAPLPLTEAVARNLLKLMAYKDEYEVARLYTDGRFERQLRQQFDGDFRLEFHMAPPLLARRGPDGVPRKMRFGPWLMPMLRLLAHGRRLRGTPLDPFGYNPDRRLERELITRYEARVAELLRTLSPQTLPLALRIAEIPRTIRGYGHVKRANLAIARAREAELLQRLEPAHDPLAPPDSPNEALHDTASRAAAHEAAGRH